MEAKDTVIEDSNKIYDICAKAMNACNDTEDIKHWRAKEALLEAQAEISFKAGYKQGVKNHHEFCKIDYKEGYRQGTIDQDGFREADLKQANLEGYQDGHNRGWNDAYKLGIKEMKEWLESTCGDKFEGYVYINKEIWQAKLKDWGI